MIARGRLPSRAKRCDVSFAEERGRICEGAIERSRGSAAAFLLLLLISKRASKEFMGFIHFRKGQLRRQPTVFLRLKSCDWRTAGWTGRIHASLVHESGIARPTLVDPTSVRREQRSLCS